MKVLGLDVSTSCTGVCVIDINDRGFVSDNIFLDHIEFKKCKTTWDKADVAKLYIERLKETTPEIGAIFVEDPAKKFTMGQSSASTIVTLARFNGLVSYFAYSAFSLDPEYISASAARKLIGLKMQQKKKCGLSHKEQTAAHVLKGDLSYVEWPTKKNGKIVDWSYDVIDAYVICKAGVIMTQVNKDG